jgi:transposase-like protein
MALSRQRFMKGVKLAAIQRLDAGASIAEIARAFEVSPICCTVGARSSATVRATRSQAAVSGAGMKARSPSWVAQLFRLSTPVFSDSHCYIHS